jgi:hypothetical protein
MKPLCIGNLVLIITLHLRTYLQGGEANKSRITANFCYSADGSHKLDVFLSPKPSASRAFKGVKHIESLGRQWKKTGKDWMNGTVFQEFLD